VAMLDGVGWIATVVFTISYFAKDPAKLRWIQSVAALFWITYGVLIHSRPVIAATSLWRELLFIPRSGC
jgi:hypothetical protein